VLTPFINAYKRVRTRVYFWFRPYRPIEDARADGVSPSVVAIMQTIESVLPPNYRARYDELSRGHRALIDALIYLHYQALPQAKAICAEAMGDPDGPGAEWVQNLLNDIDIATRMSGTDIEAGKARWRARVGLPSRQ
jgi:hypothetical protein